MSIVLIDTMIKVSIWSNINRILKLKIGEFKLFNANYVIIIRNTIEMILKHIYYKNTVLIFLISVNIVQNHLKQLGLEFNIWCFRIDQSLTN